jgi:hypothetical protein
MARIHQWWATRPDEIYWLEVTRRPDIGANLKAPQLNEHGNEFWSYSLIKEVREGDLIYHYDGVSQAIVAFSTATGVVWQDQVVWAARGSSARSAHVTPHPRSGWYFGLEKFQKLTPSIPLDTIRKHVEAIRSLKASLTEEVSEPLYFPFEITGRRPIRPMQGYLFKLPKQFLQLLGITVTAFSTVIPARAPVAGQVLGDDYRIADELVAIPERDPFAVDPSLVERGVRGHAVTQNRLADHLRSGGIEPRSPAVNEPNFDIGWRSGNKVFVAEIKSLTPQNEEKQLRLGLGQVLRYAYQLGGIGIVVPVLVVERRPNDSSWERLCEQLGVVLVWPETFSQKLQPPHAQGRGVGE